MTQSYLYLLSLILLLVLLQSSCQVEELVRQLGRDVAAHLPRELLVIAASGIKLAADETLSHWKDIILTPRCLEMWTFTLAKENGNGPLLMLPFILYHWATNNLKGPPEPNQILCFKSEPEYSSYNVPELKKLVWWMLKSIRYDATMFEEFTLAFFSLGWGRRGRETLGDLFPCFAHHHKSNLRLKILERIEIVDGILSNYQADGSLTENDPRSRAILFKGSNNVAQSGFDILIHQPRTKKAKAILIVIKCKHTDALTLQELNTNLNVVACELAPFVKGVYH